MQLLRRSPIFKEQQNNPSGFGQELLETCIRRLDLVDILWVCFCLLHIFIGIFVEDNVLFDGENQGSDGGTLDSELVSSEPD